MSESDEGMSLEEMTAKIEQMGELLMAMSAGPATAPTVDEVLERIRGAKQAPALALGSARSTACCNLGDCRDGVIVIVPEEAMVAEARGHGAPNPEKSCYVMAVDAHFGGGLILTMDADGLRHHVNNCMQAIAFLTERERGGSSHG